MTCSKFSSSIVVPGLSVIKGIKKTVNFFSALKLDNVLTNSIVTPEEIVG